MTRKISAECLEDVRKMVEKRGGMALLLDGLQKELGGRKLHRQQVWNWFKNGIEPSLGMGVLLMKVAAKNEESR
jgi:hypothetical protein